MELEYVPIQFYLQAMLPERAFTITYEYFITEHFSLYLTNAAPYRHQFPYYCLHLVMFVTAKFHRWSLSKLRTETHICCSMSTTTTPSLPCVEKFSDKGGSTPMQILEVHWRDLPLCK